jgi:hypothetical protein
MSSTNFNVERFKLKEINEVELREEYDLKISDRFAAVEDLYDTGDINSSLENIRKITKLSATGSLGQMKTAP